MSMDMQLPPEVVAALMEHMRQMQANFEQMSAAVAAQSIRSSYSGDMAKYTQAAADLDVVPSLEKIMQATSDLERDERMKNPRSKSHSANSAQTDNHPVTMAEVTLAMTQAFAAYNRPGASAPPAPSAGTSLPSNPAVKYTGKYCANCKMTDHIRVACPNVGQVCRCC